MSHWVTFATCLLWLDDLGPLCHFIKTLTQRKSSMKLLVKRTLTLEASITAWLVYSFIRLD